MPLDDALLLAVKQGVVELTVPVSAPTTDEPEAFGHAVRDLLLDHQYQVMTDATILDPYDLEVSTCLESRDPLPDHLKDVLLSLGFGPLASEAGGEQGHSMFSRFQKRQRTKLDRWRLMYARAKDLSPTLHALEECLIEEVPEGPFDEIAEEAAEVLVNAVRTYLRALIAPGLDGVRQLERRILEARGAGRGRWVLHPAAVRAIAAFVGESALAASPRSQWVDDPDGEPLWVTTRDGGQVRTDPEFRVVQLVGRGNKALLSSYLQSVVMQSG